MRIAFVAIEPPSLRKGAPVRMYNLIKQAVARGALVDLIAVAGKNVDSEKLRAMLGINSVILASPKEMPLLLELPEALVKKIPPYFLRQRRSRLGSAVCEYVKKNQPDIIQFECLHSLYALYPHINELKKFGCKLILDAHNVEYRAHELSYSVLFGPVKLLGIYMAGKLLTIEIEAARAADGIFACSAEDKIFFDSVAPGKTTLIPNGVDCKAFPALPLQSEKSLLFMGGLFYSLNADALRFYFSEVHALVKEQVPNIKIYLIGGEPTPWLEKIAGADPSIVIAGLVPDVREYIKKARVCISPIRKGSGTSLKILEYMGCAKPVVSTTVGIRGINCRSGYDLLVADGAKEFAGAIIKLMSDDALAGSLGANARKTMESNYDWEIIGAKMAASYKKLIDK